MNNRHATLLELALAEQEARNAAALAAIHARAGDIAELHRLVEALAARGAHVRPAVTTHPVGANAICRLTLWLSCTLQELGRVLEWLALADIVVSRVRNRDDGNLRVYELALRGQSVLMNASVHDELSAPVYPTAFHPAAA